MSKHNHNQKIQALAEPPQASAAPIEKDPEQSEEVKLTVRLAAAIAERDLLRAEVDALRKNSPDGAVIYHAQKPFEMTPDEAACVVPQSATSWTEEKLGAVIYRLDAAARMLPDGPIQKAMSHLTVGLIMEGRDASAEYYVDRIALIRLAVRANPGREDRVEDLLAVAENLARGRNLYD